MASLHDRILTTQVDMSMGFVEVWHALAGIYIWEFFTTLDYEWKVIRGYLPYRRWTIWIYSLTRVACLMATILILVGMDVTTPMSCQLWASSAATFFCLSSAAASLLIVLCIIAIWNRNKVVMATAISIWFVDVAFRIQNAARLRSAWDPARLHCLSVTTERGVLGLIPMIVADTALLLIMLVGLALLRRNGGCTLGLTRTLWKKGAIWLLLAFVSEIPLAVMTVLNSNDQFDNTLLTTGLTAMAMTIAATRMHRSLVGFASEFHDCAHEDRILQTSISEFKQAQDASILLDRVELTVHTAFEPHPTA